MRARPSGGTRGQNDEWLVGHHYLSQGSRRKLLPADVSPLQTRNDANDAEQRAGPTQAADAAGAAGHGGSPHHSSRRFAGNSALRVSLTRPVGGMPTADGSRAWGAEEDQNRLFLGLSDWVEGAR
jgi:hypothetical protein